MRRRLAVYTGAYSYWGPLDPGRLFRTNGGQLGGGETAAVQTALAMCRRGWEVWFLGAQSSVELSENFHICSREKDFLEALRWAGADMLVSWDAPWIYRFPLQADYKVVAYQLNDTHLGVFDWGVDAYFHPSQWHANRFAEVYGVPKKKQIPLMTNGTLETLGFDYLPLRDKRVVWTSSPDRGLHHLLQAWPLVFQQHPDAELHIYYDMSKWFRIIADAKAQGRILNTTERAEQVQAGLELVSGMNVTYHGGVSKAELADALLSAHVMAYPCDPVAPTEGFSMSILDAWTAGCKVVTTNADALEELWGGREGITILPLPVDSQVLANIIGLELSRPAGLPRVDSSLTWDGLASAWESSYLKFVRRLS